ncbi:glycosyltransferase [Sporohalobacter salinus]|uniref:glycosyltransferase n=1 Tax=Sporohalobacter salinus TaxID=1494606 RepID=UPI00195FBC3A|nr:GT2 family glycosyltransferase [Sporohalobacter salinus]
MQVIFHLQTLLNKREELLIKDLLLDLEEELQIGIGYQQQKLDLNKHRKVNLVVTDNLTVANLLAKRKTMQVIYWYRGWNDDLEEKSLYHLPMVVTKKGQKDSLPVNFQSRTAFIPFGVKEDFYQSKLEDKLITTKKRRIIISGHGLARKEIEFLVNALELIENSCQIEVVILSKEGLVLDTEMAYEVMNLESLEARVVQYASAELALIVNGKRNDRLTTLELMASQIPIVIIDQKVTDSLLDNYSDSINFDMKQIVLRTLKLLKDNTLAKKLVKKGLEIAKKHKWQKTVQSWSELIRDKLSNVITSKERKVDIVLVNNNKLEIMEGCIKNILENTDFTYRIIIIDNYDCGNSLEDFKLLSWIEVITPKKKLSYAKAYNRGIKVSNGQYILLMDTSFRVTEGWLNSLVTKLQENNEASIIKPQVWTEDEQRIGLTLSELFKQNLVQSEVDWINTNRAVYMFIRELVSEVGYFDTCYSSYFETIDYLLRIQEEGYKGCDFMGSNLYRIKQDKLEEKDVFTIEEERDLINDREFFIRKWEPFDLMEIEKQ